MFRSISLFFRRRGERRDLRSVLNTRKLWEQELAGLPVVPVQEKTLLVIRLDEIGDYLLYRNFLADYRQGKWAGYNITFAGNIIWKSLFEVYDAAAADQTIWVDKKQYFGDAGYRRTLWLKIRMAGFEAVICPSRSRPLLLDDILAMSSAAGIREAVANTYAVPEWNMISDKGYDHLFPSTSDLHEFTFNRQFSEWVNGLYHDIAAPELPTQSGGTNEIICFIGASIRSKRWPVAYWIRLVKALQQQGMNPVIGGGKNEEAAASAIVSATGVTSFAGQSSLLETLERIGAARAVVSGDTMAAHAAVAFRKPLVIIANGVNAPRFVHYQSLPAAVPAVTLYTRYYDHYLKKGSRKLFRAVSHDMHSIHPEQVVTALLQLL